MARAIAVHPVHLREPLLAHQPPEAASPELVAMHRRFLISQMAEHRAKVAALDKQRAQNPAMTIDST
jgi:hemolysin D